MALTFCPPTRIGVTRMGGPGSGRRKNDGGRKNDGDKNYVNFGADPTKVEPRTNSAAIRFGKLLMGMEPVDMADDEAVMARVIEYFNLCDSKDLRPMVTGLSMALGINRHVLSGIARGDPQYERYKGVTAKSRSVLKKAYDFLQFYLEFSMQEERGNPVKWIFLAKNYFGFRDQTERVDIQVDATPRLASPDEIAQRYLGQVGRPSIAVEATVEDASDPATLAGGDSPTPGDSQTPGDSRDSATPDH